MKLDDREYGTFKVSDLFDVKYGVNLELNACDECERGIENSVNFVARTAENNGVSSRVVVIDGVSPQKAGLISVAGGGSVLSTFLQSEPFYSGRDLYTLEPKDDISDEAKMFVITVIEQNKYRYSYGRQANKTLPDLELRLPITQEKRPDWQFMEDYIKSLHYKPLTTKNKAEQVPELKVTEWKEFRFGDLISAIYKAKAINKDDLLVANIEYDSIRYITRTAEDNGCELHAVRSELPTNIIEDGNAISIGDTTATCFYQDEEFITGDHMVVVRADSWLNKYTGLFIVAILQGEQYKYSYGRAYLMDRIKDTIVKLPVDADGNPDWQFMENYIKALPSGDRLAEKAVM